MKCNRLNLPINESVYSKDNWCHVSRRRLVDFTHDVHCSKNDDWGYALAEPCILLKVKKHNIAHPSADRWRPLDVEKF